MRKLASIQKITDLRPIEGADQIECAQVLGWHVVVKKGDFKAGDLCVYCEIDSMLPERLEFEFLREKKFRIRTIRFRGQISQGIAFPINILDGRVYGTDKREEPSYEWKEGQDVTELMGVVKYEPQLPACLSGLAKGSFPGFVPRTDEIRVQNIQKVLDIYQGTECYITEKLDGSSVTYYLKNGEFGVCSRNLELKPDDKNTFWQIAKKYEIEDKLGMVGRDIAIQGEVIGEGIQNNPLKIEGQQVYFYDVFLIDEYRYFDFYDFRKFFLNIKLPTVPILDFNFILHNEIDYLTAIAIRNSHWSRIKNIWAEGIVIRSKREIKCPEMLEFTNRDRLSFKVINPEYLLKFEN